MPEDTPESMSAPRRLLPVVGLLVALVLAADLTLGLALPEPDHAPGLPPQSTRELRAQLARAASGSERSILLIGDSVLAGSALAPHSEGWRSQRVLDYLRGETHPAESVAFHQIATDALLPTDLERVVAELHHQDPESRVELVVEINLRFLSRHYRAQAGCTRDWYCELPALDPGASSLAPDAGRAMDTLRNAVPIRRHLGRLGAAPLLPDPQVFAARERERTPGDPLAGLARIQEHYRVELDEHSAQLAALERVVSHLAGSRRPALFFATPLRDSFIESVLPYPELAALYGDLARWIDEHGGESVRFLSLDHPLFGEDHFVDHVHLTPAGNRLLAVNLLAELRVRLMRSPRRTALAYDHGIDRTLISGTDLGSLDGPPWMARLRNSNGIAFDPKGPRLILADTDRHCLRILRGNMRTLQHWAGAPAERGDVDGGLGEARFDAPHGPVVVGEAVYLLDRQGSRIREIRNDRVHTAARNPGGSWISLASDGRQAFVLGRDGRVSRLRDGELEVVLRAHRGRKLNLQQLAVSPDGRLFVADDRRIWQGPIPESGSIGFNRLELLIPGDGEGNVPPVGSTFPMSADEVGFTKITALEYVARYEGLLVVDEVSLENPVYQSIASERAHLRFLDPASRRVFPWLKPLVNGKGYFPATFRTEARASAFHISSVALDPTTLDVYLLERSRARLLRIGDGLHGASRVGDPDGNRFSPFGAKSSREIRMAFEPRRHRDRRAEQAGYRGSLMGIYAGSSLIVAADEHGYYSLARALELELSGRLGLSERLNVDLYVLSGAGANLPDSVDLALEFMEHEFVPDFVLIDANELTEDSVNAIRSGRATKELTTLARLARRHSFALAVVDSSGLGAMLRDGLLPRTPDYRSFLAELRRAGFSVIEPTAQLLPALLDVTPWGNPPHRNYQHHGSPQAIDRTAEQLASRLAPRLVAHFEEHGQRPERERLAPRRGRTGGLQALLKARGWRHIAMAPRLPSHVARAELREDRLEALVDLGRIEQLGLDVPASVRGVRAVARTFVMEDVRGQLVDELYVRFVRFSNYDEYGQGTLEAAEPVFDFTLNRQSIEELLAD